MMKVNDFKSIIKEYKSKLATILKVKRGSQQDWIY